MDLRLASLYGRYSQLGPSSAGAVDKGIVSADGPPAQAERTLLGIKRAPKPALYRVGLNGAPLSMQIQEHCASTSSVSHSPPGTMLFGSRRSCAEDPVMFEMQCRLSRGIWTGFALY